MAAELAACPDSFTVCGAPQHGLGVALIAVPLVGAVLAIIGGVALGRRSRWRDGTKGWRIALLVVVLGSALAGIIHDRVVPPGPVVYYDEFLHAETTTNLATSLNPHPCCGYERGACRPGGPIEWPLSTHLAAAAVMRLGGGTDVHDGMKARQQINRLASFIAPLLAFAWVMLLVPDALAAMIVSLALALWPGVIRLMSTADLTPGAVLFILLALIAVELQRRWQGWAATAVTIGALALACHARLESALVLPWIVWRSPRRMVAGVAAVLIVAPLVWLYVAGKATTIGWSPDVAEQLRRHVPADIAFLFSTRGALPALAVLTLVGLRNRALVPLFLTALGLLLFIAAYTFGEFRADADGFRYAIVVVVLLLPLAAAGVASLLRLGAGPRGGLGLMLAVAVLAPLVAQRSVLQAMNPVSQLDRAIEGSTLSQLRPKVIVTRSVAWARAVTNAGTILERCSASEIDHSLEEGPLYLRSWGDAGPEPYSYGCSTWMPATVGDSPDGKGPWLHYWDLSCHLD